jgi:hypothetical protein
MVQVVHVLTVGNDLPALAHARLQQTGVTRRHRRIDRHRRPDAMALECLHDAKYADPIAIVAQRVVTQIGVRGLHRPGGLEWLTLHVQREPFQRRYDPQGHTRTIGPSDRLAFGQHRPVVTVMVHAIPPMRVLEIVVWNTHVKSPVSTALVPKAGFMAPPRLPALRPRTRRNSARCSAARSPGRWPARPCHGW